MEIPFSASGRPYRILIIFLALSIFGLAILFKLQIQPTPNRNLNTITISSSIQNASPQVIEKELTSPLEQMLNRLNGIVNISSRSSFGNSNINVELDKFTHAEMTRLQVATMIRSLYPDLPKEASYPTISLNKPKESNSYREGMVGYAIQIDDINPQTSNFVKNILLPMIRSVKGVDEISTVGLNETEFLISENVNAMRSYGISHNQLRHRIDDKLLGKSFGLIQTRKDRINLFVSPTVLDLSGLTNSPIGIYNEKNFKLSDIASINPQLIEPTVVNHINGKKLITIDIYPKKNINIIEVCSLIRNKVKLISNNLPPGHALYLKYDKSTSVKSELKKVYLRSSISLLILIALILGITRQFNYALVVLLCVIVTFLLSFLLFYVGNLEIHTYSLAGITISFGLILDTVVVLVENSRHQGRQHIRFAILTSTTIALGCLSVIYFLDDTEKLNLLDFAQSVGISLIVSLPVAYWFLPSLLYVFPISAAKKNILSINKKRIIFFGRCYSVQLKFMIRFRKAFFCVFLLMLGVPLFLLPQRLDGKSLVSKIYNRTIGSEFYSKNMAFYVHNYLGGVSFQYYQNTVAANNNNKKQDASLSITVKMREGASLSMMNDVVHDLEIYLNNFHEKLKVYTTTIVSGSLAEIRITFRKEFQAGFPLKLKDLLEQKAQSSGAADFQIYGVGNGFTNELVKGDYNSTINIKGYNYNKLHEIASQINDSLKTNVRIKNTLISTGSMWDNHAFEEFSAKFKMPEYSALNHVGRKSIMDAFQDLGGQKTSVGNIDQKNIRHKISLVSRNGNKTKLWSTLNSPIQLNDTTSLRLNSQLIMTKEKMGEAINKINNTYSLNLYYQFLGSDGLNESIQRKIIEQCKKTLPYGYTVSVEDDKTLIKKIKTAHLNLVFIVLLIIYLATGIFLESFTLPIPVILMIPFSLIGVLLIFTLLDLKFDEGAYASMLFLAGIVTTPALCILQDMKLIAGKLRQSKTLNIKIFLKAFNSNAMPILITNISAVFSLLPFIIMGGDQGFWFSLSVGTVGGVIFSCLGMYLLLPLCIIKKSKNNEL